MENDPIEIEKMTIMVTSAFYSKTKKAIILTGDHDGIEVCSEIDQSCFSYGNRSPRQIEQELETVANLMVGKPINVEFTKSDISHNEK